MTPPGRIGPYAARLDPSLLLTPTGAELACRVNLWQPFRPEVALSFLRLRRLKVLAFAARRFPAHRVLVPPGGGAVRWAVYFCYAPDGTPGPNHRFTLARLRAEGFAVLCVCAARTPDEARRFLALEPDALIWKALGGYDFSGYSLGLAALASAFDGIDVLVLNDSVLGPLHPLRPVLDSSPWEVTGFMTSYSVEHHIQSFAFHLRGFGPRLHRVLRRVFFRKLSFDTQGPVSLLQETRLGSAVAGAASIGSVLTPHSSAKYNYCLLGNPAGLVAAGFPFLKGSIFGKFAASHDQEFYRAVLEERGHPVPSAVSA